MKSKFKRVLAAALAVMMITVCAVGIPTLSAQAFDNDVKSGVVAIVFYLKNAGIYITDGEQVEEVKHLGDIEFSGGSGFFIGEKKEAPTRIVTNCHVIESYLKANEGETFVYNTGQMYQNTYPIIVGAPSCELRVYYSKDDYDIAYVDCNGDVNKVDLAVLKLKNPTTKRHALKLRTPDPSMVGETVYTIGFPGNADNNFTSASKYGVEDATVHKGVINKFVTNEGKGVDRIAIDATIQHGNSGGPLVNEAGDVLGINTNVESNSPYEGQVEADYYAINTSELITFLDKNNIGYMEAGKMNVLMIVLIIVGIVLVAGGGCVVALILILKNAKKKKANAALPPASSDGANMFGEGAYPENGGFADPYAGSTIGDYGATTAPSSSAGNGVIYSQSPQHSGKKFPVGLAPVMVGRNAAECVIVYQPGTPGVSGKHCTVSFDSQSQEFTVTDLGSTFGTFLSDGRKLTPQVPEVLRPGDVVYIGDKSNPLSLELES